MWSLGMLVCPAGGFSLDLDSTVFQRAGRQQGAAKGYNPRRPGRNSHHPLLAVLAEAPFVLLGWLRSGNTGAAKGAAAFLSEALAFAAASMVGSSLSQRSQNGITVFTCVCWSMISETQIA